MKEIWFLITGQINKPEFDHKYKVFVQSGIMIRPTLLITEYEEYMLPL